MQNDDVERGLERAGFLPFVATEPDQDLPPTLYLAAAPNPATAVVDVSYRLPRSGPASITLFDLLGRQVRVLADYDHTAGEHASLLDMSAFPSGVYVLRLETASGVRALKMTVAR
jgi:hypothetical protein